MPKPARLPAIASSPDLIAALRIALGECLGLRAGENALVISDDSTAEFGEAFREAALALDAETVLIKMTEREGNGEEPPPTVAAAMSAADVFVAPTRRSLSHTEARRLASEAGARGATLPGTTPDILTRLLGADLGQLRGRTLALAELLSGAERAHISCPRGTELTLDLRDRGGLADAGDLAQPGAFGNLPFGEACVAPQGASGAVAAASLASLGLSDPEPTMLRVENDHLVEASGPHGERFFDLLARHGHDGTTIAELGIGTNEAATLTGILVEDEKLLGTAHVAFGASRGLGGTVSVPVHLDVVILEPTVYVDDTCVLAGGEWVLGSDARP